MQALAIPACLTLLFCGVSAGQPLAQADQVPTGSFPDELSRRLQIAIEARNSRDPYTIGRASQQVIALALVEMARVRLDEKAYGEAIRLCMESLEFEDTAQTRLETAISNLYSNNPSEAAKQASLATELDPQNALAWTISGESLLRTKDYVHAATALHRALEISPEAEPTYSLGIAQLGLGDKEAAAQSFFQFLALTGDSGWSRVLVGRAYQEQAFMQDARTQYEKALLVDPATPNAHYFWALNLLKENAWSPTPDVYAHLNNELRLNPRHFEANYMLGSLALNARDYKRADQYLQLATQVNPLLPETWVLLGLSAKNRGAKHAAEVYFRKAIALAKNLDTKQYLEVRKAYYALGRILLTSGRGREGRELLNKARELEEQLLTEGQKRLSPKNGQDDEKPSEAVAPYVPESDLDRRPSVSPPPTKDSTTSEDSSASARTPPHASEGKATRHLEAVLGSSFNDLATAEALRENYALAYKYYREAASWDPRIPGLQRNLGLAAFFAGQPSEAVQLLSKVVAQAPSDAHARAVLGMAYVARQDFSKAVQTISPIANQTLEDPLLGFAWAKSLAKTGNRAGAIRALQNLERTNTSPSVDTLIQFGQLWQELGNDNHATELFHRALLIDPDNADAKCGLRLAKCP